ncbi:MAG TPA: 50S ribosomal protein L3 [Chloroflexota bacterium]|jgi:large subunit ribosomal protein L3|nr:50S ribosomal protein L3 [Chloroflexota bacterium]
MIEGLLGRKVGMTQIFSSDGRVVPVTVIEAGPCYVTQIRTVEADGYQAVQLGFGETKTKRLTKAEHGHLQKATVPSLRHLREVRAGDLSDVALGQRVDASVFQVGELVDVVGTSKGKGFAGVVKRHHFRGGPRSHGQSDRERAPGSSGSTTTPGRVLKGTGKAGQMGNARVTVQSLEVVESDGERNLLLVKGAVPGARHGLLLIRKARKGQNP